MEIKFSNVIDEKHFGLEVNAEISLVVTPENYVYITLNHSEGINETNKRSLSYQINKNQLSDFIGALLHVQQKLNKKR